MKIGDFDGYSHNHNNRISSNSSGLVFVDILRNNTIAVQVN